MSKPTLRLRAHIPQGNGGETLVLPLVVDPEPPLKAFSLVALTPADHYECKRALLAKDQPLPLPLPSKLTTLLDT